MKIKIRVKDNNKQIKTCGFTKLFKQSALACGFFERDEQGNTIAIKTRQFRKSFIEYCNINYRYSKNPNKNGDDYFNKKISEKEVKRMERTKYNYSTRTILILRLFKNYLVDCFPKREKIVTKIPLNITFSESLVFPTIEAVNKAQNRLLYNNECEYFISGMNGINDEYNNEKIIYLDDFFNNDSKFEL